MTNYYCPKCEQIWFNKEADDWQCSACRATLLVRTDNMLAAGGVFYILQESDIP